MSKERSGRREFLKSSITTAGAAWAATRAASAATAGGAGGGPAAQAPPDPAPAAGPARPPRLKFSVIGINHGHVNGQTDLVKRGGGELVSFYAKEPDLAAAFAKKY